MALHSLYSSTFFLAYSGKKQLCLIPMSLEEVLMSTSSKLDAMTQKFDVLQADVDSLEAARERTTEARRSRS